MVPAFWLNEGGQSATGALLDHVIFSHTASGVAQWVMLQWVLLHQKVERLPPPLEFMAKPPGVLCHTGGSS